MSWTGFSARFDNTTSRQRRQHQEERNAEREEQA